MRSNYVIGLIWLPVKGEVGADYGKFGDGWVWRGGLGGGWVGPRIVWCNGGLMGLEWGAARADETGEAEIGMTK